MWYMCSRMWYMWSRMNNIGAQSVGICAHGCECVLKDVVYVFKDVQGLKDE
jgi:hypothetical protein